MVETVPARFVEATVTVMRAESVKVPEYAPLSRSAAKSLVLSVYIATVNAVAPEAGLTAIDWTPEFRTPL